MKKIIVYTGSFNPVTKAHINIINKVKGIKNVNKVYVVPVGDFYKKSDLASAEDRYNMLKPFEDDKVTISRVEIDAKEQLKTIDTLNIIKKKHKNHKIYLVIGSDNLIDFKNWYKAEELISNYNLLVIQRADYNPLKDLIKNNELIYKYKSNLDELKIDSNELSSTKVRDAIRINDLDSLNEMIEEITKEYLINNNLYGNCYKG